MLNIIRKPVVSPIEKIELKAYKESYHTLVITRSRKTPGGITLYTKNFEDGQTSITIPKEELPEFLAAITELCGL